MNRILLLSLISCFTGSILCSESLTNSKDSTAFVNIVAPHLKDKEDAYKLCSSICAGNDIDDARFSQAVIGHEEEFITRLVESQINLSEWFGGSYGTLLSMGARWDNYALVKALLDKGADPNIQQEGTDNTLSFAIGRHTKVLKLLLERGAKPASSSLDLAAEVNNGLAVQLLLERKVPIIADEDNNGMTPLGTAVARSGNKMTVVKLLVEKGHANVNHRDDDGSTPVHYFAEKNKITEEDREVLAFLVANGALLDSQNTHGRTALSVAAVNNNVVAITTLLRLGASPNIIDNGGRTPLGTALLYNRAEAVAVLVRLGARTDDEDPLEIATWADEPLCLESLLASIGIYKKKRN